MMPFLHCGVLPLLSESLGHFALLCALKRKTAQCAGGCQCSVRTLRGAPEQMLDVRGYEMTRYNND